MDIVIKLVLTIKRPEIFLFVVLFGFFQPDVFFLAFCGNTVQTFIYNELIWGEFKVQISYQLSDSKNRVTYALKTREK